MAITSSNNLLMSVTGVSINILKIYMDITAYPLQYTGGQDSKLSW